MKMFPFQAFVSSEQPGTTWNPWRNSRLEWQTSTYWRMHTSTSNSCSPSIDFGELIYRRGATVPAGVLYLRFIPATPEEPGVIIRDLLEKKAISMRDRFTVVQRERIRQRPLPKVM